MPGRGPVWCGNSRQDLRCSPPSLPVGQQNTLAAALKEYGALRRTIYAAKYPLRSGLSAQNLPPAQQGRIPARTPPGRGTGPRSAKSHAKRFSYQSEQRSGHYRR
jgi:hypothetical protein